MITKPVRQLIESIPSVLVATSDPSGQPHVAIGDQVYISGDTVLVFENWFCPATLQNITGNSHVSVMAVSQDTGKGYQMLGSVIKSTGDTIFTECDQSVHGHKSPQVLTRFSVKVEQVLEFSGGIHSDIPIA